MGANNMYVAGCRETAPTAGSSHNSVHLPAIEPRIDIPCQHADFLPPDHTGEWPPSQFEGLTPDSDHKEISDAIEWVDELAGWFHSIDLPHDIRTPGGRGWSSRSDIFDVPDLVRGQTVLDLGAMEGGDTFHAEQCGAASMTACDVDNYFGYDLGRNAAWDFAVERYLESRASGPLAEWAFMNSKRLGFELCRRARGSVATRISASVYELAPEIHGVFDIVYCFGLLYHLRHPILAVDRVRSVTGKVALFNNQIAGRGDNELRLYSDTWRGSFTNWFIPTPECFLEMLSSSGFSRLEVVDMNEKSMSVKAYV